MRYRRDRHHEDAVSLWRDSTEALLTTNYILGETWTFIRRRLGHDQVRDFVDRATSSRRLVIHRVDEATELDAWQWLRRHDERAYSFVDATSFAVMRRLRLLEALAFDGDFSAAGFVELRP